MATSNFRRLLAGGLLIAVAAGVAAVAAVLFAFLAGNMPPDAPLARMYRTEGVVRQAVAAITAYRAQHGVYPRAGAEGLHAAWRMAGQPALPGPVDAWDQPLVYLPHDAYTTSGLPVMPCDGGPCAPQTFQVYSVGADGDPGLYDPERRVDNITGWDAAPVWREAYQARHKTFMMGKQGGEP